jgi:hypothetical protein
MPSLSLLLLLLPLAQVLAVAAAEVIVDVLLLF